MRIVGPYGQAEMALAWPDNALPSLESLPVLGGASSAPPNPLDLAWPEGDQSGCLVLSGGWSGRLQELAGVGS